MSFKLPDLDKTDYQSVMSWHTDMQDLWMIMDDELSIILDESADLNTLKEKLEAYFKAFNDSVGPNGDQILFKIKEDLLDVENSGSGDGCWIVRNESWWWVKDTPHVAYDQSYNNEDKAHSYVVDMMCSCMWWGDEEIVHSSFHEMIKNIKEEKDK